MKVRLGYVAMTMNLHECSPSGTVTLNVLNKLPDDAAKLYRLRKVAKSNLENTLRILRYNLAYNIKVYRLTSKLIPLANHPATAGWDYISDFKELYEEIGAFIRENDFRVSAHPDHFTLINSPTEKILEDSLKDLDYHVKLFEAMGLEDDRYKLVMHVGGLYKDKAPSIERFKMNFSKLPDRIRKRMILENDDKSYTAADVLGICNELGIPMVIDIHHHNCVSGGERLEDILPRVFDTWNGEYFKPKIHFSSPKSEKDFRSHSDFIDFGEFQQFIEIAGKVGRDFDVMLEAKQKDQALLKLHEKLKGWNAVKVINEGEFVV